MGGPAAEDRPRQLAAGGGTATVAAHEGRGEFGEVGDRGVHRTGGADLRAFVVRLGLALVIPSIRQVARKVGTPDQGRARHAEVFEQTRPGPDPPENPVPYQ
jgi:hypothetical protein